MAEQKVNIVLKVLTKGFSIGLRGAVMSLRGFVSAVRSASKMAVKFFRSIKRWALIATAAFVALVYQAAKFQKSMAFVATMVKDTDKHMGNFTKGVKDLAVKFGIATDKIARALYDVLSAAVPPEQALKVLEATAKSAIGGFVDMAQVGKSLVGVMNAMGISYDQVTRVADVLHRVVERGVITFGELSNSLARAMVSARLGRVTFEELAAAYAFLTRRTFNAAMAETAMAAALKAIYSPTAEAKRAAAELGIELSATALDAKGFVGIMEDLAKAGLTPEEIAKLFPNVRAQRAIAAMISSVKEFRGDVEAMYTAGGAQARAYAKAVDTLTHQFNKFVQAIKVLFIDLITPMLPALQQLFNRLVALGNYLKSTIVGDVAKDIKDFAFKAVEKIEDAIFRLVAVLPYIFGKIWGYIEKTSKMIEHTLDYGMFNKFLETLWNGTKLFFQNLGGFIYAFVKNLGIRMYETIRWAWWKIRSFITGEVIPEFVYDFTGLLEDFKWEWEVAVPKSFRKGMEKINNWYYTYSIKLENSYTKRLKKLEEIKKISRQKTFDAEKKVGEESKKLDHSFQHEKMNERKKAIDEIIKEELARISKLKSLGQTSLTSELNILKKLMKATEIHSNERIDLIKRIYEIEKGLRQKALEDAYELIEFEEHSEYEKYRLKIKLMEDFVEREDLSYKERKDAFKRLMKLKMSLVKKERELQKKFHDEYIQDAWKQLKAAENILRKRRFMTAKDSNSRQKIDRALQRNLIEQEKQRWRFIKQLRIREKDQSIDDHVVRLMLAQRHAEESIRSGKLTAKERKKAEREIAKIEEQLMNAHHTAMKKDEKEKKDFKEREKIWRKKFEEAYEKSTGERIQSEQEKEIKAQQERIEKTKELEKKSSEILDEGKKKVSEFSSSVKDKMIDASKAIIEAFEKIEKSIIAVLQKCAKLKLCGISPNGLITPGAKDILMPQGKGTQIDQKIIVGPIHIGQLTGNVDARKAGEIMSEELGHEALRRFRMP